MNNESWYAAKLSDMDVVRICDSDDFVVDYDKNRGMYRVSFFGDGHFKDECWFDAYEEKEVEKMYMVYGVGDTDVWTEAIFDDREQALACAEWLNLTEKNDGWHYFIGNGVWSLNKLDYVDKLKKLKGDNH